MTDEKNTESLVDPEQRWYDYIYELRCRIGESNKKIHLAEEFHIRCKGVFDKTDHEIMLLCKKREESKGHWGHGEREAIPLEDSEFLQRVERLNDYVWNEDKKSGRCIANSISQYIFSAFEEKFRDRTLTEKEYVYIMFTNPEQFYEDVKWAREVEEKERLKRPDKYNEHRGYLPWQIYHFGEIDPLDYLAPLVQPKTEETKSISEEVNFKCSIRKGAEKKKKK
jgi:hypothetical protein